MKLEGQLLSGAVDLLLPLLLPLSLSPPFPLKQYNRQYKVPEQIQCNSMSQQQGVA